jgi:hypothetical protein
VFVGAKSAGIGIAAPGSAFGPGSEFDFGFSAKLFFGALSFEVQLLPFYQIGGNLGGMGASARN